MAKKKQHRSGKASIAILPILPVAGAVLNAQAAAGTMGTKGWGQKFANEMSKNVTGYDFIGGTFSATEMAPLWIGEGVAIIGHKIANKTGVNNFIRKATMGFVSL
jgi:hypothetical protein